MTLMFSRKGWRYPENHNLGTFTQKKSDITVQFSSEDILGLRSIPKDVKCFLSFKDRRMGCVSCLKVAIMKKFGKKES